LRDTDLPSPRELIESTVLERATHLTTDSVGDTRSFANMELTLTREYWGRFLIELLQNARDAWLEGTGGGAEGIIRIRLTKDPALVVCNEGEPLTPEVVLQSISKFGESPKAYGTAIGHKGIGFKAVLELTRVPRLYSRRDAQGPFDLQVRFDPEEARRLVMSRSPNWNDMVAELLSSGVDQGGADRIPVLRYPSWDDSPPEWLDEVAEFDGHRFNTIVALPFDSRFETQLGLTRDDFIDRVRRAIRELSDEVVLLLSVFGRVVIEDEIAGETHEVVRSERPLPDRPQGVTLSDITISRDGAPSGRWWLFEQTLPGHAQLEGDIAVGVRLANNEDGAPTPVGPMETVHDGSRADCFHLFFPTRIRTHLPYLFHAYFEVDAGRKSFAEDKESANQSRLDGLVDLTLEATRYLVSRAVTDELSLVSLPGLFAAEDGEPDDKLAKQFRDELLAGLDREAWVVALGGETMSFAAPADLLIDSRQPLPELLPIALPASYVQRRLGRAYAQMADREGLKFLANRNAIARGCPETPGLDAGSLAELLHPDDEGIWTDAIDVGFRALLQVLDHTMRDDADIHALLETVRSDSAATFIPVVEEAGRRRLRPPGQRRPVAGAEDADEVGGILARVSVTTEAPLVPPASLGLDFLADGLVDADLLNGIGGRLGIRPYQTESILDAIAASPEEPMSAPEVLLFAWRLLLREWLSSYSLANVLRDSSTFEPGRWFWSRPGSNREDAGRGVRRARALARLRMPAKDGEWRRAGDLAFGAEWAVWQRQSQHRVGSAAVDRAEAYGDLEAAAPGPDALAAGPADLAGLLPLDPDDVRWLESDVGPELPSDLKERHLLLLHAFLLRLGVWEIPPILGHVDYRPEVEPPWATQTDWSDYQAWVGESDAAFIAFGHKNVSVAEDYRLAWPMRADSAFVRAMSRGAPTYRKYQRAVLFCPQCRTAGIRHNRRYSSEEGDLPIPSSMRWQLTQRAWLPTTVGNGPTATAMPGEAWQEEPDEGRMQQSWMRFLPLVVSEVSDELALLLGVARLRDADTSRIGALLRALRSQFDSGQIDAERRAGSLESQALVGLHWRLYEQLAKRDAEAGAALLNEVGVLASLGRLLVYSSPDEVRHDDGTFSAYKRYFAGQMAFSILPRDKGAIGESLGIPRFRLDLQRISGGQETTVTDQVRFYIHERVAEFLALQMYHSLGTQPLLPDSRAFRERAERLQRLEVVQVDDLVLRVEVVDAGLMSEVGAGRGEDMYLDDQSNPPVLYHDLAGNQWEERFRQLAGPYLATLLENPAYSATFQLLLQQDTPAEVEAFLDEQSVSPDDVDDVRRHLELISGVLRTEERRWWSVLLPLLGVEASTASDAEVYATQTRDAMEAVAEAMGAPVLAGLVLGAGGADAVRKDSSADGALAALEQLGVNLAELHRRLQEAGDQGLVVDVALRLLANWKHLHGREVSAILVKRGDDADTAKALPESWRVGSELAFQIRVGPAEFLAPVVADLLRVGLMADPDLMAGADGSAYLASLVDETPDELAAAWQGLFDEQERARLDLEHAVAWRSALRPILVAAITRPGDPPNAIRTALEEVDRGTGVSPANTQAVADRLPLVLVNAAGLADALTSLVMGDRTLAMPSPTEVREVALPFIDVDHLDRVIDVLRRGRRQFVDQVRQDIEKVKAAGVMAKPFEGSVPPPGPRPRQRGTRIKVGPRRAHDQRTRDRLGVQGERAALAVVLEAILTGAVADQNAIIGALIDVLLEVAEEGEIVASLVSHGQSAMAATDDDNRLESLARFLWVAQKSDDFGFDLIGFLAPYTGAEPCPLLLEVKNSADRSFLVSTGEWRRAEEQRERYAFLVVVRSTGNAPEVMELVPNPADRVELKELSRREETWRVSYRPSSSSAEHTAAP
jgi:Domain of unknown function (DUF3883)